MCAVPSGSWGGGCLSLAPDVTGAGATIGYRAPFPSYVPSAPGASSRKLTSSARTTCGNSAVRSLAG